MDNIVQLLSKISWEGKSPEVLGDCSGDMDRYNQVREIFNLKFQFRPAAIVMCECTEHVSQALTIAIANRYHIRVRSGGHDHEGECSGTDTVLIDLSKMKKVEVTELAGVPVAKIGPGNKFEELIPKLAEYDVCVPHGTCGTVCIAGFTMGGGWGPWTRIHGFCCDSLEGVTMVLGDGAIKVITSGSTLQGDKELLWALRGGGGMSYGIVTELVIKTFVLPETIKFNVEWNTTPAYEILKHWEHIITPERNVKLIGTNLQIMAIPEPPAGSDIKTNIHPCTFNGYYAGTEKELKRDLRIWFADIPPTQVYIPGNNANNNMLGFSGWDRVAPKEMLGRLAATKLLSAPLFNLESDAPLQVKPIPPDSDAPAPHKITSRIVNETGWDDAGRETLLRTLESRLVYEAGIEAGVQCYVTLGAISGQFYANYKDPGFPMGSAIPYKKRPFTIQYQAWWMQGAENIHLGIANDVNLYSNRAQDWIEECRQTSFPQTRGSFISFKDSSVPTEQYFLESYTRLKAIKMTYSLDPQNNLRTRKTII